MDFSFNPDEKALKDTVRSFLDRRASLKATRAVVDAGQPFEFETWKQLAADLGLAALLVPEVLGGAGGTFVDAMIVLEEMGRVLYSGPFLSSSVQGVQALLVSGDSEAMSDYLPSIGSGDLRCTFAVADDAGSWALDATRCIASASGDGFVLNGVKSYVIDGGTSDLLLATALLEDRPRMFAVPAATPSVAVDDLAAMDPTRQLSRAVFTDAPARLLAPAVPDGGWIEIAIALGALALACELVGVIDMAHQMSVGYAKVREQFGQPIGAFQAIKHKCSDMYVELEAARSITYLAGWAAAQSDSDAETLAAMAKAMAADAACQVSADNIQIHGGMGFAWEHDAHLYYKRAHSSRQLFGSSAFHLDRVSASFPGVRGF
jgi:alkylation response protein AidB-like acyl-CoA dehydrogenase